METDASVCIGVGSQLDALGTTISFTNGDVLTYEDVVSVTGAGNFLIVVFRSKVVDTKEDDRTNWAKYQTKQTWYPIDSVKSVTHEGITEWQGTTKRR